jgi:hypothetical protein
MRWLVKSSYVRASSRRRRVRRFVNRVRCELLGHRRGWQVSLGTEGYVRRAATDRDAWATSTCARDCGLTEMRTAESHTGQMSEETIRSSRWVNA